MSLPDPIQPRITLPAATLATYVQIDEVARTISQVLAQLNELERAEAAREAAAREARIALAGLGGRLVDAKSLAHELERLLRQGGSQRHAPAALAKIRQTVSTVVRELAARFPTGAVNAPPDRLHQLTEVVGRLRAEVESANQASALSADEARDLRDLAERVRREHAVAIANLEAHVGPERATRLLAEPAEAALASPQLGIALAPPADLAPSTALMRAPAPFDVEIAHSPVTPAAAVAVTSPPAPAPAPRLVAAREEPPAAAPPSPEAEASPRLEPSPDSVLRPRTRLRRGPLLVWSQARGTNWLARTVRQLAVEDPDAAADLALALLPAQQWRGKDPLVYTVAVRDLASFCVTIDHGFTTVDEFDILAPGTGEFHIDATLPEFTDFACGALRRRGSSLRVTGNRRQLNRLLRGAHTLTLADVADLGIPVDPDLALLALASAIEPEWTRGYSFTIAFDVRGDRGGSWIVTVLDGQAVRVARADPGRHATSRLTLSQEAFLRFVCNRTVPGDPMPRVEGDKHVAVMLLRWMTRAQDQADSPGPRRLELDRSTAAA